MASAADNSTSIGNVAGRRLAANGGPGACGSRAATNSCAPAGTLLASESLYVARFLDWMEVQLRMLWKWGMRHWVQTPTWGRVLLVMAVAVLSATSTYLSYRLFWG